MGNKHRNRYYQSTMNNNNRRQRMLNAQTNFVNQALASITQQATNGVVAQLAARVPGPSGANLRGTRRAKSAATPAAQQNIQAPGKTQVARRDAPLAHATRLKTRGGVETMPAQNAGEVCFSRDVVVGNLVKTGASGVDSPATLNGASRLVFNPGNSSLFPWIDAVAGLFQEYHMDTLSLEFIPARNATTDGQIVMSSRINTQDLAPATIVSLLQQDGAACNVYEGIGMKCQVRKRWLKTAQGNSNNIQTEAGNEADSTEYLAGEVFFRSDAAVDTDTTIGLVKLHYKIRFRYPKPALSLTGSAQFDSGSGNATSINSFGTTFSETRNTLSPTLTMSATGHVLTINNFPGGQFLVVIDWVPAAGTTQYGNVTYSIGGTAVETTTALPGSLPYVTPLGAGALMAMQTIVTAPGTFIITMSGALIPSSPGTPTARCFVRISPAM